mgnify:CR=1 FL=1
MDTERAFASFSTLEDAGQSTLEVVSGDANGNGIDEVLIFEVELEDLNP